VTRKKKPIADEGKPMHVSVVLDPALVKALDKEAERLSAERKGLTVRRTDVIRMALNEWIAGRPKASSK